MMIYPHSKPTIPFFHIIYLAQVVLYYFIRSSPKVYPMTVIYESVTAQLTYFLKRSLMAEWLRRRVSGKWHALFMVWKEVMGANPGQVKLEVRRTSVQVLLEQKKKNSCTPLTICHLSPSFALSSTFMEHLWTCSASFAQPS